MSVTVYNRQGESVGTVSVDPANFGGEVNKQLLHDVVLMHLANQRAGTHSTKRRGEVAGSTKKLFRQKGTGKWTSQDALDLQVPVPTIDLAVTARDTSGMADERKAVAQALGTPIAVYAGDRAAFLAEVGQALNAATRMARKSASDPDSSFPDTTFSGTVGITMSPFDAPGAGTSWRRAIL